MDTFNHSMQQEANMPKAMPTDPPQVDLSESQTNTTVSAAPSNNPVAVNAAAQLQEQKRLRDEKLKPVSTHFPYFAGLSLAFGVLYTFCLYRNPGGITYPLFVVVAVLCGVLASLKLGRPIKAGSWFLLAAAVVIGIGTCRTAEWFLISVNGLALVLLGCVFALHQFYDDREWNIGKYFASIILYLCHAVGQLPMPFQHFSNYIKQQENKSVRRISLFFIGILIAIPMLFVLVLLLGAADAVFAQLVHQVVWNILKPTTLFPIIFMTAFGFLAMYCIICCCCLLPLKSNVEDRRKGEPLIALACMGCIVFVYIVFCVIQINFLFLRRGSLPIGYTYSEYARQGFFQLLFVAFFNLIMVLCCLKYIRPNMVMNLLLTAISGCTYIMLASAGYRMMLYVQTYHLTYLRLIVLWFLAMLAILLIGVTLIIWKSRFPLFRFSLVVVTVFYIGLVWARPASILGWDYARHLDRTQISQSDLLYMIYSLSADAAPAIAALELTPEEVKDVLPSASQYPSSQPNAWLPAYYNIHAGSKYRDMGLRNYNFALAKIKRLTPN